MSLLTEKLRVFHRIAAGGNVHILALGSSNTEHFMVGAHWFDYVQLGFMHKFRRWDHETSHVDNPALCLNAGTSNNTTGELLARFDRDVAPFRPDLIILTAGINDANPARQVPLDKFCANLIELRERTNALGGDILFQTYYSCDMERLAVNHPDWAANYMPYMRIVREVAEEYLNDNFIRWERLRRYDVTAFRLLMRDDLHLNPVGNAVVGLDLIRALDLTLPEENLPWIRDGVFARLTMDILETKEKMEK